MLPQVWLESRPYGLKVVRKCYRRYGLKVESKNNLECTTLLLIWRNSDHRLISCGASITVEDLFSDLCSSKNYLAQHPECCYEGYENSQVYIRIG
jgi:hypothetical protein